MNIVINGDFLMHRITGVQRYALEVTKKIDDLINAYPEYQVILLIPSDCNVSLHLKNISIVRYKKYRRFFWLQFDLWKYCRKKHALCLCMATVVPFFYAGNSVNVIHDACTLAHPEFYSKRYRLMSEVLIWKQIKRFRKVITVSQFSKDEICRYTGIESGDVAVAYNSYEHFNSVESDFSIIDKLGLQKKNYFYSLSSLSPNKNFKWILAEAKNNPEETFVISGMKIDLFADADLGDQPDNVIFTGYISDEQVKALLSECKTFLFPTFYEGFGIPPLEALSCGARITVSDTPVMHEIYENCPNYIDPYNDTYSAEELIGNKNRYEEILKKYSWGKTASTILDAIKQQRYQL